MPARNPGTAVTVVLMGTVSLALQQAQTKRKHLASPWWEAHPPTPTPHLAQQGERRESNPSRPARFCTSKHLGLRRVRTLKHTETSLRRLSSAIWKQEET